MPLTDGRQAASEKRQRNQQGQEKVLDEPADIQSGDGESTIGSLLCGRSVVCACVIELASNQQGLIACMVDGHDSLVGWLTSAAGSEPAFMRARASFFNASTRSKSAAAMMGRSSNS